MCGLEHGVSEQIKNMRKEGGGKKANHCVMSFFFFSKGPPGSCNLIQLPFNTTIK